MKSTDKAEFGTAFAHCMGVIYEKEIMPDLLTVWFAVLQPYSIAAVKAAFESYITDPKDCRFAPKPGDIVKHIEARQDDDGRPGLDEAWGMLIRIVNDERETGILTEEIRAGWAACQPILDLGDEVGARMTFRETYTREVENARRGGFKPRWTPTIGTDLTLRQTRLKEAVKAGRIGLDAARSLLPGPTPASLSEVAGLLEGPDATQQELEMSQRFRELARILRSSSAASEQRRVEESRRRREQEAKQKAEIQKLLEERKRMTAQGKPNEGEVKAA